MMSNMTRYDAIFLEKGFRYYILFIVNYTRLHMEW